MVVGFLILSGAVNTAIVGSNGVLNRVSEDGVLPDWFLKPHPRFGTSSRLINLVVILQIVTIVCSRGDVLTLGEAYAFGVVWSFVFMSLSMLDPPLQAARAPRVRGAVQHPGRAIRLAGGHDADLPGAGGRGDRQPADEGGGDDHRRGFHGWLLRGLLGERACPPPPPGQSTPSQHEHLEQFNQKQAEQLSVRVAAI